MPERVGCLVLAWLQQGRPYVLTEQSENYLFLRPTTSQAFPSRRFSEYVGKCFQSATGGRLTQQMLRRIFAKGMALLPATALPPCASPCLPLPSFSFLCGPPPTPSIICLPLHPLPPSASLFPLLHSLASHWLPGTHSACICLPLPSWASLCSPLPPSACMCTPLHPCARFHLFCPPLPAISSLCPHVPSANECRFSGPPSSGV